MSSNTFKMQVEAISQLLHFGVPGAMLVCFLLGLRYMLDQHRDERKELFTQHREERQQLISQSNDHAERFAETVEKNTSAFTDLKNAIQNLK